MVTYAEAKWGESARRYEAIKAENLKEQWVEHHKHLRDCFWRMGDEHHKELLKLGWRELEEEV